MGFLPAVQGQYKRNDKTELQAINILISKTVPQSIRLTLASQYHAPQLNSLLKKNLYAKL